MSSWLRRPLSRLEGSLAVSACASGRGKSIKDSPDCPLCRRQAKRHFGSWPLEALKTVERSGHPRIWRMHKMSLSKFLAFREGSGWPSAWPLPREQIRDFLTALDSQRLPSPNIIAYLTGLSYISRMLHFPDPLQDFLIPRLVIGLHRRGDIQTKGWTPLSLDMLHGLLEAINSVCATLYDRVLFQAMFLLAWFAALRPEEMVTENQTSLDPALLRLNDFAFLEDSFRIQLRILGIGPERFVFRLGRGKQSLPCVVVAVSKYLEARPCIPRPFFIHGNGEPVTKGQFLAVFHPALTLVGLLPQHFSLNSFWVGALVTAAKNRLPERLLVRLARCPDRRNPQ
ncbi:uncharacterized protein LOC143819411 [Paroedura picta]|uniref:uncharacterized protein LOC143819411 n=1 Tax=Paroedura picta TaxID=143630 RepID=UPI00405710E2